MVEVEVDDDDDDDERNRTAGFFDCPDPSRASARDRVSSDGFSVSVRPVGHARQYGEQSVAF